MKTLKNKVLIVKGLSFDTGSVYLLNLDYEATIKFDCCSFRIYFIYSIGE